jgi:predicted ATPase
MPVKRAITEVSATNFLSLKDVKVTLDALTVLVGPNGGGKSNFLSIFGFLGEVARTDLSPAVLSIYGNFSKMLFQGVAPSSSISISIKGQITEHSSEAAPDEYMLRFWPAKSSDRMLFRHEVVTLKRTNGRGRRITLSGRKVEFAKQVPSKAGQSSSAHSGQNAPMKLGIERDASALSVLRRIGNASDTKQISDLAEIFETMRLFDPAVPVARRASSKSNSASLEANASNLAAVLLRMRNQTPEIFSALEQDVKQILPGFRGFQFVAGGPDGDTVAIEILEDPFEIATPLSRVSFGTIRAVALFAMLREPDPPKLTCIEEVDHGLHPYALDVLVERLRDASTRTQIIIATHSPALVNRLNAEELRIFERDWSTGETRIVNLTSKQLSEMREASGFELGELWFSGALGGTP